MKITFLDCIVVLVIILCFLVIWLSGGCGVEMNYKVSQCYCDPNNVIVEVSYKRTGDLYLEDVYLKKGDFEVRIGMQNTSGAETLKALPNATGKYYFGDTSSSNLVYPRDCYE